VKAQALAAYDGHIVQLRFSDDAILRARILSVDPDVARHHVFYDVLSVVQDGSSYEPAPKVGESYACSADDILEVINSEGLAPLKPKTMQPWWKLW
jgi:hypothetical protein